MTNFKNLLFAPLAVAILFAASNASAGVTGGFGTDGTGSNGDTTLTLTSISFGPSTNLLVTSSSLSYGVGSLIALPIGTLGDIANASALPLDDFITFAGTPLDFTLTGLGPGSTNTDCADLANFQTCSIPLGGGFISPVVLELQNGTTVASLTVFGTVTDGTGVTSNWSGTLSASLTQDLNAGNPVLTNPVDPLTGMEAPTPGNIEAYFAADPGGSITSPHEDTFSVVLPAAIPEPTTWSLMLGGLLTGVGAILRKRSKA